jgi:hypothetical protein
MKYSMKCVDRALLLVFPDSIAWPKSINRVTRMQMAANHFFLYPKKNMESFDMGCADLVIRAALLQLEQDGSIQYGPYNIFTGNTADF